jgi:phosphatidylserine decarboxylase
MIASEGFWYVIIPMLLFLVCMILGIWRKKAWLFIPAGLFLLLWFSMMFFFRDPARPQPAETAIVSVSDGVVDEIVQLPNGSTRIEVYLSLLNVHALRSPFTGVVSGYEFKPGNFIPAQRLESVEKNQRVTIEMLTDHGPIQFSGISGAIARRVIVDVSPGDSLLAGQRIGFVRFGSRSELILPNGVQPAVSLGDVVHAGVSIVGIVAELPSIDTIGAMGSGDES